MMQITSLLASFFIFCLIASAYDSSRYGMTMISEYQLSKSDLINQNH